MLLERNGTRIELKNPADIAVFRKNGYVEIKQKDEEPKIDPNELAEDVLPPEAEKSKK